MGDLKALIEAVEAGTAKGEDFNVAPSAGWFGHSEMDAYRAYHGDMNAALALFKELLPGWDWMKPAAEWKPDSVAVVSPHIEPPGPDDDCAGRPWFVGEYQTPARALLLATMKAVEAQR